MVIVGSADDPAKISEPKSAVDAYTRKANSRAKSFSRGDNSGTHKKEMDVWQKAGITPSGDWYIVTGDELIHAAGGSGKGAGTMRNLAG